MGNAELLLRAMRAVGAPHPCWRNPMIRISTLHLALPLALSALVSTASASPPCDQKITRGTWMYTCEGAFPGGAPTRTLGRCTASETGKWNRGGRLNYAGLLVPQKLESKEDRLDPATCVGFINYKVNDGADPDLPIEYVVSKAGNAINGSPLVPGGVLSCSLQRIDNGNDN